MQLRLASVFPARFRWGGERGLERKIAEAIPCHHDKHNLAPKKALAPGRCDFVMANPPFDVDLVDAGAPGFSAAMA